MKLLTVFILGSLMQTYAVVSNAQNKRITLRFENSTLKEVLQKLEDETEFSFIYKDELVNSASRVTENFRDEKVTDLLTKVLKNENMTYMINGRVIVIMPNDSGSPNNQQQKTISGKVTDTSGASLPGVSVVVKGTTTGVVTDNAGNYSIGIPNNAVLQFSFVGMKSQEVAIGGKTIINVAMVEETIGIEEVVAVGYGTQKKASLTGAISSVKSAELITTKSESVTNMLAGKMAGVRTVQSTGEPGSYASSIQIRGFGTPLIIVDGVPRDNMARLNPNEIESISVLKDGSAAIYGVRASNGVILITTKKGDKGKMKLEYNGYYGMQTPIRTPNGLNAWQYMEIANENSIMRGSVAPGNLIYKQSEIDAYKNGDKTGTEWWKINSDYNAPQYQHNLSATGSSGIIDYFVNFGNFSQQGVYSTGDLNYKRYNLRSNVSAKINKNLKVELLINGTSDEKNSPYSAVEQYWRMVWVLRPITPLYANNNPSYPQMALMGQNPLVMSNSDIVGYKRNRQNILQSTANLIWDIPWIKGLQAKGSYSYDYTFWEDKSLQRPYNLYNYDAAKDFYSPAIQGNTVLPGSSAVTRNATFGINTLLNGSLSFNRDFGGKHHTSALLLYEESTNKMDNFGASRYITMTSIEELFAGVDLNQQALMNGNNFYQYANKALVGRANYDYMNRYYGEFSFRYDGSSKFATGQQWGFFPSASAAWRISEEPFFKKSSSMSFIQNLKLRASYGITGDDRTATFQYVPGYTYPVSNFFWPTRMFGDSKAAGVKLRDTPNPYLTWMTSKIYDVGFDADMWNNLLGLELDFYQRDRKGLVATREVVIPDWLGEGLAMENLNSDRTYGFDLTLKHRNSINTRIGKLYYGISSNVGLTRTKMIYVERKASVDQYDNWRNNPTNRPNDIWWGYSTVGRFQNWDEIISYPILDGKGNTYMKPGDYKLEDWNEDGVIDSWDQHPIASGANMQNTPRIFFGSMIDIQFKGFDLTAVLQGGAMTRVKQSSFLSHPFTFDDNGADIFYDRWHMKDPLADPKDPRTEWISGYYPTISQASPSLNTNVSANTITIRNADYLRLKSLELGYTLPKNLTDKIGIQGVRIYATAYNLMTLTKLKFLDPEHPAANDDLLYPLIRTINFGGSINF